MLLFRGPFRKKCDVLDGLAAVTWHKHTRKLVVVVMVVMEALHIKCIIVTFVLYFVFLVLSS